MSNRSKQPLHATQDIAERNFGELNGQCISNKNTIMSEINACLGTSCNPSIEYIITLPFSLLALPYVGGINYNTFGHSAIRYTTPDGRDVVVNIAGKDGETFIRIHDAKEYFYGTDPRLCGAQRGVYNRDFVGLRVENVPAEDIKELHEYV